MSDDQLPQATARLNVGLTRESAEALSKLQGKTGLSKVDAVNRALVLYEFIDAELRAGNEVIVRDASGRDQLVKFIF